MILASFEDYEGGWYTVVGGSGAQQDEWSSRLEYVQILIPPGTLKQTSVI